MRRISSLIMSGLIMLMGTGLVFATPSTQIWNPSTDVQGYKTWHFGVDNYSSVKDNKDKPVAFATDLGLTYGLLKNLEVGIDFFTPAVDPVYFNFKYGLPEKEKIPALAAGMFSMGTENDVTNYNIGYVVAAKTFKPVGRFTIGYYQGNKELLIDENGEKANTGIIATWDKQVTDKLWLSLDYASGKSAYGSLTPGFAYSFKCVNASVIFGYVIYNNDKITVNDTLTTQLDINF